MGGRCFYSASRRAARDGAVQAESGDEQGILFTQLCNVLEPGIAVALSSVRRRGLRTATRAAESEEKSEDEESEGEDEAGEEDGEGV